MNWHGISMQDWVALAVGVLGVVSAYLSRKTQLPVWARNWLKKIGAQNVMDAIERAEAIIELTPQERRDKAVDYLKALAKKELGFEIPTSIANLLVEFIYQQWKRRSSNA